MNTTPRAYWAPHVTVAVVVERAGKLLLVEEAIGSAPGIWKRAKASPGRPAARRWKKPAGRWS